ncbi:hypothetical protein HDV06_002080 [Boothiomyces sp. JEL0866]|nr:hypothetical protein HDV06_002080 [Boothiomyces sp. JEL0866]
MYLLGLATAINGTSFGALSFVGLVDARTFLTIIKKDNPDQFIKTLFPVWWPNGRDMMASLGLLGLVTNGLVYYQTRDMLFGVSATTQLLTLLWTGTVMRESISTLVKAQGKDLKAIVEKFCVLHIPRIVFAGIGYASSIYYFLQ